MTSPIVTSAAAWRRSRFVTFELAAALALVVLAVFSGRGQLVALATPLILHGLWALAARPTLPVGLRTAPMVSPDREDRLHLEAVAAAGSAPEGTLVRLKVHFPGVPGRDLLIATPAGRPAHFSVISVRTGTRQLFSFRGMGLTATLGWSSTEFATAPQEILVLPRFEPLPRAASTETVRGLTGPRRSRFQGQGSEFRDIAQMAPGDRIRQIDWRGTARNSPDLEQLYVRRNFAQAEATAMLLVDSRDDVGPELASWSAAHEPRPDRLTSLDIARSAAASLAKTALDAGDRVGMEDLGRPRSPVLPGTGPRHLTRIQYSLALAHPLGAPSARLRAPFVPAGSLVYVLSTFLDSTAATTIASLVRQGHRVIAIDTLPEVSTWSLIERQYLAWNLVSLERRAHIRLAQNLGVPVIAWVAPDRNQQLAVLARPVRTLTSARKA